MIEWYEQIYKKDGTESVFGLRERKLVDFLRGHYFPQKNACDLGCGDGRHAIYLASNGWHVTAIDNSANGLKRLEAERKRLGLEKSLDLLCEDLGKVKLDENTFDFSLCVNTILELGEQTTKHLLDEAKKSTKANGIIYLAFFVPYLGTEMRKNCYYPNEAEIIRNFPGWEVLAQATISYEHEHITQDSLNQPKIHKHMQAHIFLKKQGK